MTDLALAWKRFEDAAQDAAKTPIARLFDQEAGRLSALTIEAAGLTLDLSKQPWDEAAVEAALDLAHAADVEGARDRMIAGAAINSTEGRAVLHTALRAPDPRPEVARSRAALKAFADGVASGAISAADGKPFSHILHIGIGGSDLGPRLVWEALKPLNPKIGISFVANVDPAEIAAATAALDPARTLVIVVSKTFTTAETMANARAAKAWLGENATKHLAAVSTNLEKTGDFGVDPDRVFGFWDWVGGRFSLWSAVGLSCACALGWDIFERLLGGAARMDEHFKATPMAENAPVMLALSHLFNRNGLGRTSRAVIPYAQRLRLFPAFLQQLEMESNGKPGARPTGAVVFGDAGTNGQHAFFQLLHQGTDIIPVDFVAVVENSEGDGSQQKALLANCVAQAEALMIGRDAAEPHRRFEGNRPSAMILMDALTPEALGALIALYEHKVFVEGVVLGINSFDQWGVELGKTLASAILAELEGGPAGVHDPSTAAMIARLKP